MRSLRFSLAEDKNMKELIKEAILLHSESLKSLEENVQVIEKVANTFISCLKNKGKIIFIGNGGSAADAQHLAAEFVGRFNLNRPALASIALSTNTSTLTAVGNDFGFEEVFSRQIQALTLPQDVVVGISTSGQSKNIEKAIKEAKNLGAKTIGFLGKDGGKLKEIVDISLVIKNPHTPRIQEMHILAGHIICEIVEKLLTK